MYDWLDEKKFSASNGISFSCDDKFKSGFINGIVGLNPDFKGKEGMISPEFTNFEAFKSNLSRIEAAIKELNSVFGTIPPRPIIKINVSQKAYLRAQHKFQASNGIIIMAATRYHPGFENGNPNTLYLDDRFDGKEVVLGPWFRNREQFAARMDEITVALREIEEAEPVQGPLPAGATEPETDRTARMLAALMTRVLLDD